MNVKVQHKVEYIEIHFRHIHPKQPFNLTINAENTKLHSKNIEIKRNDVKQHLKNYILHRTVMRGHSGWQVWHLTTHCHLCVNRTPTSVNA